MNSPSPAPRITHSLPLWKTWRRALHTMPEAGFKERKTSRFVSGILKELGLKVHTGLAGTGIVATLRAGHSSRRILLRADLDGVTGTESGTRRHRSQHAGLMHACGHDGHMAMLLGAAQHLAAYPQFDGIVDFLFQPAEENLGGGAAVVQAGLFRKWPATRIFALHNWPDLPLGTIAIHRGPVMAASSRVAITVHGKGCHAAMPQAGIDPILIAAQIITALQGIVTRSLSPLDPAILSITQIHGGHTSNVIPAEVTLDGTIRTLKPAVQRKVQQRIRQTATCIARAAGGHALVEFPDAYPVTVNDPKAAAIARQAAARTVSARHVITDIAPSMAAEDFAYLLQQRPGCYAWLGTGSGRHSPPLHNPGFEFNDDALPYGVTYWVRLVETALPHRPLHAPSARRK